MNPATITDERLKRLIDRLEYDARFIAAALRRLAAVEKDNDMLEATLSTPELYVGVISEAFEKHMGELVKDARAKQAQAESRLAAVEGAAIAYRDANARFMSIIAGGDRQEVREAEWAEVEAKHRLFAALTDVEAEPASSSAAGGEDGS